MRLLLLSTLVASSAFADSVWLIKTGDQKISVIKEVRTATGLGLKEAKDLVEAAPPQLIKSGLDKKSADALVAKLSAAGATAELRPDGASAPTATKTGGTDVEGKYSVHLQSFGQAKIPCIKVVKETFGLGLKEAKELVESAPVVVRRGMAKDAAEKLAKQLNDAGGEAKALLAGD